MLPEVFQTNCWDVPWVMSLSTDPDRRFTADVASQQGIVTFHTHLIPCLVFPVAISVCDVFDFVFFLMGS